MFRKMILLGCAFVSAAAFAADSTAFNEKAYATQVRTSVASSPWKSAAYVALSLYGIGRACTNDIFQLIQTRGEEALSKTSDAKQVAKDEFSKAMDDAVAKIKDSQCKTEALKFKVSVVTAIDIGGPVVMKDAQFIYRTLYAGALEAEQKAQQLQNQELPKSK